MPVNNKIFSENKFYKNILKECSVNSILLMLTICFSQVINLSGQELKLYGDVKPGSLMFGYSDSLYQVFLDNTLIQSYNGYFVLGFDRDERGKHILKTKYINGKVELRTLKLSDRKYHIEKINDIDPEKVEPPDSELDRIAKERDLLTAARDEIGKIDTAFYTAGIIKPLEGGRITGEFGSQRILRGVKKSPHNGLDIAAPEGTDVYAMTDGIVRFVADNFYYAGNFILIDHGQGLSSIYLHLSKTLVSKGQKVFKGEKIGEVGTTGRSTGPHLHWGIQWFSKRIDPALLLELKLPFNN